MTDETHILLGKIIATQEHHGHLLEKVCVTVQNHESLKNKIIGLCVAVSAGVGMTLEGISNGIKNIFSSHG